MASYLGRRKFLATLGPAAAAFFAQLDLDLNELSVLPLENSRKERVGEIRT